MKKNFMLLMATALVLAALGCSNTGSDWKRYGSEIGMSAPMPAEPQSKKTWKDSTDPHRHYKDSKPMKQVTITKHQLILRKPGPDAKPTPFQDSDGDLKAVQKAAAFGNDLSPEVVEMALIVYEFHPDFPQESIPLVLIRRYPAGIPKVSKVEVDGNEWTHNKAVYKLREGGQIRIERERYLAKGNKGYVLRLSGPVGQDFMEAFMDRVKLEGA